MTTLCAPRWHYKDQGWLLEAGQFPRKELAKHQTLPKMEHTAASDKKKEKHKNKKLKLL